MPVAVWVEENSIDRRWSDDDTDYFYQRGMKEEPKAELPPLALDSVLKKLEQTKRMSQRFPEVPLGIIARVYFQLKPLEYECLYSLGEKKISAFGVKTMSPGVPGISNKEVHHICGELNFTHYENMINLHFLLGKGRFRFIGFPLKIKGETGSQVRAVAIFEK